MTKQINNEPAYPVYEEDSYGNPMQQHFGLTKREAFAMAAMQGLIAHYGVQYDSNTVDAVQFADSLLEALNNET